jgi:hypothetical protein
VAEGVKRKKAGSLKELFGDPRWRRNTIVGMVLASTGVIGLWGIGFFSVDLYQTVFRKNYEAAEREAGEAERDRLFIARIVADPEQGGEFIDKLLPKQIISETARQKDAQQIYAAIMDLSDTITGLKRIRPDLVDTRLNRYKIIMSKNSIMRRVSTKFPLPPEQDKERQERIAAYLTAPSSGETFSFQSNVDRISARAKKIDGNVSFWAGMTSILFNIGGFCGAYGFSYITGWLGRRWAFVVSFLLAGICTCIAFLYMNNAVDLFWMTPLMGGSIFLIFGGYAIYFPELYPTRLRSTGTSFCYNIGRYVAALGPLSLGLLSSEVFKNFPEPMRYAGAAMCAIFVIGLLALPFAPETKDQPLPE